MTTTPEPGRLASLGSNTDRADALAVISVVQAWGPRPQSLVRFALTKGWEYPRYPRPLMLRGVSLPGPWPWSPAARAEHAATVAEGRPTRPRGLVLEHVQPIGAVVEAVIKDRALRDPDALIAFLGQRLTYAVITKAEDDLLTAADKAGLRVDHGDPWGRYRAAGIDVEQFAPLKSAKPRKAIAGSSQAHQLRAAPAATQCKRGHDLTPENTYIQPNGFRACKACKADAAARFRERHAR